MLSFQFIVEIKTLNYFSHQTISMKIIDTKKELDN